MVSDTEKLRDALKRLCEFKRFLLASAGAAGYRLTAEGEWVCDPWTKAFEEADALIQRMDKELKCTASKPCT